MSIRVDEVARVARLARLRLEPAEAERLALELATILQHVSVLREVDVTDADAAEQAGPPAAPLRPEDLPADAMAAPPGKVSPEWVDGFFTVPTLPALDSGGGEPGPEPGEAGSGAGPSDPS